MSESEHFFILKILKIAVFLPHAKGKLKKKVRRKLNKIGKNYAIVDVIVYKVGTFIGNFRPRKLDDYISQFTSNGLRCYEIRGNKVDDRGLDGIRVATMHRVKGLEFQYVFIVAANKRIIPLASAIDHTDSVSEQETMTAEKCLLYVALTRAQKGAYVSGYGQMSEFVTTK